METQSKSCTVSCNVPSSISLGDHCWSFSSSFLSSSCLKQQWLGLVSSIQSPYQEGLKRKTQNEKSNGHKNTGVSWVIKQYPTINVYVTIFNYFNFDSEKYSFFPSFWKRIWLKPKTPMCLSSHCYGGKEASQWWESEFSQSQKTLLLQLGTKYCATVIELM